MRFGSLTTKWRIHGRTDYNIATQRGTLMAKISNAQRAVDLVTLFKAQGESVQSVQIDGKSIKIWFKDKDEPVHEFDFVDWKAN